MCCLQALQIERRQRISRTPKSLSYSFVVSRESVCIAFLLASLNDVEVLVCEILSVYLNAPVGEKV